MLLQCTVFKLVGPRNRETEDQVTSSENLKISHSLPQAVEPTCASPPRLENKKFIELTVDEFACPPDLLSAPRFVEANAGEYIWMKLMLMAPIWL